MHFGHIGYELGCNLQTWFLVHRAIKPDLMCVYKTQQYVIIIGNIQYINFNFAHCAVVPRIRRSCKQLVQHTRLAGYMQQLICST